MQLIPFDPSMTAALARCYNDLVAPMPCAPSARHARINTDWNNYRAYLFYTNLGYRFLDRTFGFRKKLG